ncbi:MAG: hypothetical protein QM734_08635 [Cyclobacteriaceae bacterium]
MYQKLDTTVYIKFTENKDFSEKFKFSEWQTSFDINTKTLEARASLNKLIGTVTLDSMYIQLDTVNFVAIKKENISFDTLNKRVLVKVKLDIEISEKTLNPVLLFGKGALITVDNDSTKSADLKINIPKVKKQAY